MWKCINATQNMWWVSKLKASQTWGKNQLKSLLKCIEEIIHLLDDLIFLKTFSRVHFSFCFHKPLLTTSSFSIQRKMDSLESLPLLSSIFFIYPKMLERKNKKSKQGLKVQKNTSFLTIDSNNSDIFLT